MKEHVRQYMLQEHMVEAGQRVLVGVSGGADSVCLLLLLWELQQDLDISLEAVHVNHGIRGEEAKRDEQFVEDLCRHLQVPLCVRQADIPALAKATGQTLEQAGRTVRYEVFAELAGAGNGVVAVAHHQDDAEETMLLHLFRGSGLSGLRGIAPERILQTKWGKIRVIRPLLCVSREEIETELARRGQPYVTDSTNLLPEGSRNHIRQQVVPVVRKHVQPQLHPVLAKERELFGELDDYMCGQADAFLQQSENCQMKSDAVELCISGLKALHPALQRYVIRQGICRVTGQLTDVSQVHIQSVLELMEKQSGRRVDLPGGLVCRRDFDVLVLYAEERRCEIPEASLKNQTFLFSDWEVVPTIFEVEEDFLEKNQEILQDSLYTKWIDCDKIENGIVFRTRMPGDYLCVNVAQNHKKLKTYMIEEKILQQHRDAWLLAADGGHIIWVCGHRISTAYRITAATRRVCRLTLQRKAKQEVTDEGSCSCNVQ